MSTAPGRWARDVNFRPGALSNTVDVEFVIHEGLQEGNGPSMHRPHTGSHVTAAGSTLCGKLVH